MGFAPKKVRFLSSGRSKKQELRSENPRTNILKNKVGSSTTSFAPIESKFFGRAKETRALSNSSPYFSLQILTNQITSIHTN